MLWVVRKNTKDEMRNAMPCYECCKTLKKLGFRKVVYSTDDGEMVIVDMRNFMNYNTSNSQNMTSIHSQGI